MASGIHIKPCANHADVMVKGKSKFCEDCRLERRRTKNLIANSARYHSKKATNPFCGCGCGERTADSYKDHPEILVVHHKDGDRSNNSLSNLSILCPTCHAVEHLYMGNKRLGPSARTRKVS